MSLRAAAAALALLTALAGASTHAAAVAEPGVVVAPPTIAENPECPPGPVVPTHEQALQGMRDAVDSGLLWKATKGGRSVYLYGTIHVAKLAWVYPGPHVAAAIRASDVVALELDVTDPGVLERLRRLIVRGPGSPTLAPSLQQRLAAQMAAACIAPAALAPLRAEMQAVTVEVMQGRPFGLYPEYGIDEAIAAFARNLRKPVRALETPELQAGLLVSDDPAETADTVGAVLDELEGGRSPQMLQRLAGDWQRGDLADLGAYASWCECLETPRQRADFAKLIDERNPLMADKIVKWHAEGKSLFVAVGALHMVGPVGLPALLEARGFRVERVAFAASPQAR
jgi:uncharacterized protein YbaP (TraB family)